jgi:uncharacterized coiled-coil protein SlyX
MTTPRQRLACAVARLAHLNRDSSILADQLRELNRLRDRVRDLEQRSTKLRFSVHDPCTRTRKPPSSVNL